MPDGQDPPRIYATARCTSGVEHYRYINSRGEREVVLEGLGAGAFELHASSMSGFGGAGAASGEGAIHKTIESDGSTEIVLEMDMRQACGGARLPPLERGL